MRKPDTSYRHSLIRSAAGLAGDVAVAAALVNACIWIIEAAALGLFLQFMLWLLAALIALALSQYVIHPAVNLLLAEDKLTQAGRAFASFRRSVEEQFGPVAATVPWSAVLAEAARLKGKYA